MLLLSARLLKKGRNIFLIQYQDRKRAEIKNTEKARDFRWRLKESVRTITHTKITGISTFVPYLADDFDFGCSINYWSNHRNSQYLAKFQRIEFISRCDNFS